VLWLFFALAWKRNMFVQMTFRFLALPVRSSSLRSCGTPQPKTVASGEGFLKRCCLLISSRASVASAIYPWRLN